MQALLKYKINKCKTENAPASGYGKVTGIDPAPPAWQGVDGTGQTIGLVEFDNFNSSDVNDFLNFIGARTSGSDRDQQSQRERRERHSRPHRPQRGRSVG